MKSKLVRDWMTLTPYTTSPEALLIDAYQVMKSYEIRRLPVLDEENRLVGVITLGDIRALVTSQLMETPETLRILEEHTVASAMTKNPVTVGPEEMLSTAAQMMFENKFGGLPVVARGQLVGIISESDIFRFVMSTTQEGEGVYED